MSPFDIKSEAEWGDILAKFSAEVKMTACLTDATGAQLFCVGDRYPLCGGIRDDKEALTFICAKTNSTMLAEIKTSLKPQVDLCEAGLVRVVAPVIKDNELVGQVTACGLASDSDEPDTFLVSKQLGISEEKALELAKSTPLGCEETAKELVTKLFHELSGNGNGSGK